MLVDWFTVGAQVLNFIVLVWLLKRFLYKPILDAIDAREKRIADERAGADAKKAEAERLRGEFMTKNAEFEKQRTALMAEATEEARAERKRLVEQAREAADALSAKRRETLETELRALRKSIGERTKSEVFVLARKALKDLADADLEERMTAVFVDRLRAMSGDEKAALRKGMLRKGIKGGLEPAVVCSAFDLSTEQSTLIQTALDEIFGDELLIRFETAPDLIGGIEFVACGQKVAWSIDDYLESLEAGVSALLDGKKIPDTKASPPTVAEARTH
jgi:F-type H+-transporting ATPase subunit b